MTRVYGSKSPFANCHIIYKESEFVVLQVHVSGLSFLRSQNKKPYVENSFLGKLVFPIL